MGGGVADHEIGVNTMIAPDVMGQLSASQPGD